MYRVSVVGIGGGDIFFIVKLFSMKSWHRFNFISTIQPKITLFVNLVNPNLFYSCLLRVDFIYKLSRCQRNKVTFANILDSYFNSLKLSKSVYFFSF